MQMVGGGEYFFSALFGRYPAFSVTYKIRRRDILVGNIEDDNVTRLF